MKKTALLVGGGIDTWAVALTLKEQGVDFDPVFVNYGQACAPEEFMACTKLANELDTELINLITDRLVKTNSDGLLFGLGDNPIVNLRNLEMIQLTACEGYTTIYLALLNERGIMFPDANKNFMDKIGVVYKEAYNITVEAPFITCDKWDFVTDTHHKTPFFDKISTCWTPVNGKGCGVCGHCVKLSKIESYYKEKYNVVGPV